MVKWAEALVLGLMDKGCTAQSAALFWLVGVRVCGGLYVVVLFAY